MRCKFTDYAKAMIVLLNISVGFLTETANPRMILVAIFLKHHICPSKLT